MTPEEQGVLFARTLEHFPNHGREWASGYVHGVKNCQDGMTEPLRRYATGPGNSSYYALGYIRGFADVYGTGVAHTEWGRLAGLTVTDIDFRWWDREDG